MARLRFPTGRGGARRSRRIGRIIRQFVIRHFKLCHANTIFRLDESLNCAILLLIKLIFIQWLR